MSYFYIYYNIITAKCQVFCKTFFNFALISQTKGCFGSNMIYHFVTFWNNIPYTPFHPIQLSLVFFRSTKYNDLVRFLRKRSVISIFTNLFTGAACK